MTSRNRTWNRTVILIGVLASIPAADAAGTLDVTFSVSPSAIVMGPDIAGTDWPTRLATPSDEGQFEVLVAKGSVPVRSPACESRYLVIRMPASVAIGDNPAVAAAVMRKKALFGRMMELYNRRETLTLHVFPGPYAKRAPDGRIELTGCNLFFQEPTQ